VTMRRKTAPDPEIVLHPDTGRQINVKNGDWVWLETPKVKKGKGQVQGKDQQRDSSGYSAGSLWLVLA